MKIFDRIKDNDITDRFRLAVISGEIIAVWLNIWGLQPLFVINTAILF